MGHMAGYFSTYKPYVDVERELENCKEKVEHLRQKNNLLSKEVGLLKCKLAFLGNIHNILVISHITRFVLTLGGRSENRNQIIRDSECNPV